jgi:NADPH-dependent curcumin reductase CurA
MTIRSREVHLASRPEGRPTTDNFKIVDVELPDPGPEQVLVRNSFMSVDPYMRPRMDDVDSYVPAFEIDAPLDGAAVGEVIASTSSSVVLGELVSHALGWREYALLPERRIQRLARSRASPTVHLGVLGMPGLTAYVGLHDIAQLTDGDIVFVSAAAGAVGSLVCQLAKARGHTVIGSAGSSEKVSYLLDELGLDAAFDYHDGPVTEQLAVAAPDGIDVYFDNVGGDHLEAALAVANDHARFALCGAVAGYNDAVPPAGPRTFCGWPLASARKCGGSS